MSRWLTFFFCCFALIVQSGCTLLTFSPKTPPKVLSGDSRPLLQNPQMEPDAAVLEIFFVRRSLGDASINIDAWKEADSLKIPTDLRYQLNKNGFRFGQLSRKMPTEMIQLLRNPGAKSGSDKRGMGNHRSNDNLAGTDSPTSSTSSDSADSTASDADNRDRNDNIVRVDTESNLAKEESVVCRRLEISPRRPSEVLASEVYDELTVLTHHDGGIGGQTYRNAQCVFELKSELLPNGSVKLSLLPEIQFGQTRQQFSVQQGVVKLEYGRNRETFNKLKTTASLRPGEIIILSCDSGLSGSLGSHFFTDASTKGIYQKLLVIRLAQTQHDSLFPPDGEKTTDLSVVSETD